MTNAHGDQPLSTCIMSSETSSLIGFIKNCLYSIHTFISILQLQLTHHSCYRIVQSLALAGTVT